MHQKFEGFVTFHGTTISGDYGGVLETVDKLSSSYNCLDDRDLIFTLYGLAPDIQPLLHAAEESRGECEESGAYSGSSFMAASANFSGTERMGARKRLKTVYMDTDYSLNTRQVYQAFATACLTKGKVVPLLNAVLARQNFQSLDDWPS